MNAIQNVTSETIYLPIGSNYVNHWGAWEAFREIIQNAVDTGDFAVRKSELHGKLTIISKGGLLELSSLMLGESSKRDDDSKIGKYGEGYKLAMLVLCRMGMQVHVVNGKSKWSVSIQEHPQLKADCLTIDVSSSGAEADTDEVSFVVEGLTDEHFNILDNNFICMDGFEVQAEHLGSYCFDYDYSDDRKVFVGGLFVCNLPEDDDYHHSYNFAPNVLELDRDRGSVDSFYLQYEVSKLITESGNIELLTHLANNGAADVSDYYNPKSGGGYMSSGSGNEQSEKIEKFAIDGFIQNHGENAYPINRDDSSDQKKAYHVKCVQGGLVPVEVKPALYKLLPQSLKDKISAVKIKGLISDTLLKFIEDNKKHMRSKPIKHLNSIIESLQLQGK